MAGKSMADQLAALMGKTPPPVQQPPGPSVRPEREQDMPDIICLSNMTEVVWRTPDNFALWLNFGVKVKAGKIDNTHLRTHPHFIFNADLLKHLQSCQAEQASALFAAHGELKFSPDWRLIVGIGNESVYETSMTLHHVYGIPYIPASAIKGMIRSFYIREKFGLDAKGEENALQDKIFCDIFGCQKESHYQEAREGRVFFLDAFPVNKIELEADVMNVHYSDYYGGPTGPLDCLKVNPIPFLTVSKQTQFCLRYGVKKQADAGLLDTVKGWLKTALQQQGIGAKTAVGYGYVAV